jgi:hypothetical protein
MHMLLHASPSGVVLKVEQVMRVLGQQSHFSAEVRALEVRHDLKALLPYEVFLIPNWEKRDRQCYCSGEVALTQGGVSDVCHHLDGGVELAVDDGPRPWLNGVKGYHHTDLAHVQAMDNGQSIAVDRCILVVAETDECVI